MIEKLSQSGLTRELYLRGAGVSPASTSLSPFHHILSEELSKTQPLERAILDFLIKTIESIWTGERRKDPGFFPPVLPISGEMGFGTQPPSPKVLPEDLPGRSAGRLKGQEIDGIVQEAADRYGMDPALIKAVISVESNGNPWAVSPAGAQGLMQLMPRTATGLGVTDPFDPRQNIMAGTRYLSRLLERYQGNRSLALAAYNWGMGNLEKNPQDLPKETQNYIVRVEKRLQTYLGDSSPA
jgi:hypothetical protein